jgi:serine/threonine protein kinase
VSRASLADGTVVCDGFRVDRLVRQDSGTETYRATGPGGQSCMLHVLFLRVRDRSLVRWKHEITAVNRVSHPAVPKTLGGGATEAGRAVIVTQPVSGESLEELRRAWGGRMPGEAAIAHMCEVLEALEAAHSRGVVHGALRPRSVFVDPERVDTRIVIGDFGYSRLFEESHQRGRSLSDTGLTSVFLAPEQRGGTYVADARTDIYAVAAVAMYLLGQDGIVLMATETEGEKSRTMRKKLIADRVAEAKLPSGVATALEKAISPSRTERQAAARVLLEDLRQAMGGIPSLAPRNVDTHDDPPTIATIAELQQILIEEARLSMGATDTGVDPLAVPRVETPFQAPTAQPSSPAASAPATPASSRPETTSDAPVAVPPPPDDDDLDEPATLIAARAPVPIASVSSPVSVPVPSPISVPVPVPSEPARVSVGSGRSERPAEPSEAERQHLGKLLAGRYVLDRPLASGGMATVYLGALVESGGVARTVAIKRVHPSLAVDAKCTAMMLDEARMASRISHANVVPILDVVREGSEIMLVLEYVHGVTASQLAREGSNQTSIPANVASAIVCGALRGLDAAHAATDVQGRPMGLVHRDISPQNIMVGLDGAARVIDFGIARALGRAEVTTGTELRGKVAYMAPERLRGQKTDLRVDLWSAGVVLWELVMGTKLFQAEDPIEAAVKVCTGSIPQTGNDPLDGVLERALARDLDDRYPTAGDMANALEAAVPPASPAEVSAFMRKGCARLLDAQTAALASLKNRIEKGNVEPVYPRLRTPMGFGVTKLSDVAPPDEKPAAAAPEPQAASRVSSAPPPATAAPAPAPAEPEAPAPTAAPDAPEPQKSPETGAAVAPAAPSPQDAEPKLELDYKPSPAAPKAAAPAEAGLVEPSASARLPAVAEPKAASSVGPVLAVLAVLLGVAALLGFFMMWLARG